MTDEEIAREVTKDYKFSFHGLLLKNYGTEKRPWWYPTDKTEDLISLARKFYELGLKESNICQQPH